MLARVSPLVLLAVAGLARAQCTGQQIVQNDPQNSDNNGYSVAMNGPYMLTGAIAKKVNNFADAGKVYAWVPTNGVWNQVTSFTAPTPSEGAYFGCSVALGGNAEWAAVGARGYVGSAGKAYIYWHNPNTNQWNMWSWLDGTTGSAMGTVVAMNTPGTLAVMSAPVADITDAFGYTFAAGQVKVVTRSGTAWTIEDELHQTNGLIRHSNDGYGYSVACDGGTVVIGVINGGDAAHSECGYIHIWNKVGPQWTNSGEIYAPDAAWNASFGSAVGISGDTIAVGSRDATHQGLAHAGCVYIFRNVNGSWVYDSTLHATDAAADDLFGENLSLRGNTLAVDTWHPAQKTYIFRRTPAGQWVQDARYKNPGVPTDRFACATAVGTGSFVVGADRYNTASATEAGSAWVFTTPTVGSDSCAGATPVAFGTLSGCTNNCTEDGASNCDFTPAGPDVWYSYTAQGTGSITIDTQGSTLDTILSVHSGCPGTAANAIACNDDFAYPQLWSKVSLNVVQGQTYRIRVAGYNHQVGNYTLNISLLNACYPNCDGSTLSPVLNIQDFSCFLNKFASSDPYANCDGSTVAPVLNVQDFSCFLNKFAAGCS